MGRWFGTNGIRGIVGDDLDATLAQRLGHAFGTVLPEGARVAVGHDHRRSGSMLAAACRSGLMACGVDVVDVGLLPTPAVQYYVQDQGLDGGVVVTASHNPPEYNGLKLIAADGTEADPDLEALVEQALDRDTPRRSTWDSVGRCVARNDGLHRYVEAVRRQVDPESIRDAGFKVVLDPGGGTGCLAGPSFLEGLGVTTVPVACGLDPTFSARPSEPVPANAAAAMQAVQETGADLGALMDGDADRVVFLDAEGDYIWGDRTLALLARDEVRRAGGGVVCTGISTSSCLEDVVEAEGGSVVRTRVGSPIVARAMQQHKAVFGGEDNGGLIFARHQYCRDALMGLGAMLDLMAREERSLRDLAADIPSYALVKRTVKVPEERKAAVMDAVAAAVQDASGLQRVDRTDGVKASFKDGWFLVRPSGTEPILRVQAEGKDEAGAARMADLGERFVRAAL